MSPRPEVTLEPSAVRPAPRYSIRALAGATRMLAGASLMLLLCVACERGANANPSPADTSVAAPPQLRVAAPGPDAPAAKLGDQTISMAEVDAQVIALDAEVMQRLYDARRRAVDQIVETRLLDQEAARRGIERDALLKAEVESRVPQVTDAQVKAFYEENQGAVGSQTLDALSDRIRSYLRERDLDERRRTYLDSLKEAAGFAMLLEPPRRNLAVAPDEPARGPATAKVTLVEYSDFECPFCARVLPTLNELVDVYGDDIRIVYRDYPLAMHADAQKAAEAAQCAHDQDKFWDYHNLLFKSQSDLAPESLKRYAGDLGLDTAAFATCLDDGKHRDAVTLETRTGSEMGVSGTPAFFINGRFVSGARPIQDFREIIDDELQRTAAE